VVFFFPLLPWEEIVKVMRQTSLFLKGGGEAEKEGFWLMRKGLGERFGVAFSFAVVVTDTELYWRRPKCSGYLSHCLVL
jgi:hypothetical protein